MTETVYLIVITGFAIVLFTEVKSKHFFKNVFISALQGVVSLISVNLLGLLTGVTIAVNWYTLLVTAIFGIPGCITFVLLNCCFLQ